MTIGSYTFAHPWFFLLLLLIPLLLLWHWYKYRHEMPRLKMSSLDAFAKSNPSIKARLRPLLFLLKVAAITALIIALARPQRSLSEKEINVEGIDIVLAMDVSGSMLAQDFEPNRLGAAKKVAEEFIEKRPYDRIGIVVFAGESFTQCPLTTDKEVLTSLLREIKSGLIQDGTAIGMGLATAVTRLKESDAKSKVVILLTDGVNNAGFIDPLTAAEAAREFDVKTYTIGVGTQGKAPYPQRGFFGNVTQAMMEVNIDEDLLKEIANMTEGKYYRATDNNSLRNIYAEIDQLEKTEQKFLTISRQTEHFHGFALFAGICLLLNFLLKQTLFRSIT